MSEKGIVITNSVNDLFAIEVGLMLSEALKEVRAILVS
jgi:hypothetical protein